MKKFFAFMLMFLMVGTLAACGDSEDQEAVDRAIGNLSIPQEMSNIRGNFEVPAQIQDLDVTWEVDRDDLIGFGNVVEGNMYPELEVQVTRPEPGEGDQDITLTATIIKGDAEATREFEGRVRQMVEIDSYTDFSELYANTSMRDIITAQGIVTATFNAGYFLYDGNQHIGIYNFDHGMSLGDEVSVTGEYSRYNTLYQLGSIEDQEILSSDNDYHVEPTVTTLADFHDQDLEDVELHGHHFTVTGRIETRGEYDNMAIVDLNDSDLYFMVYHQSWASDIEVLEDNEGEIVEITVIYYTEHSRDGVLVVFQGDEDDLGEVELGDEELFNSDVSQVDGSSYLTFEDNVTLPTMGENDTVFSGWTSSDDDLIADDGSFVSRPTNDTEVTLTGTATLGTLSEDVEVTVTVVGTETMSISDALDHNDGENVHVEGIVTAIDIFGNGIFMQEEDGPGIYIRMFSRDEEMFEDVKPGDMITVYGTLGRFTNHGNNERQITDDKLLTSKEEGHSITPITDQTPEDVITGWTEYDEDGDANQPGAGVNLMLYYMEDITVSDLNRFGDAFFGERIDDTQLLIDLEAHDDIGFPQFNGNLDEEDEREDYSVELTHIEFVVARLHFGNIRVIITDYEIAD